jgi:hypothetical protein
MKKLFVLLSILFLMGSVTFAQIESSEKQVKTEKQTKIKKEVSSEKELKVKPVDNNSKVAKKDKDEKPVDIKDAKKDDAEESAQNESGAEITFKETSHDFGNIPFKGNGSYEFVFVNTGTEPLILTQPKSSCGCTVPEWPKQPILPGESNVIKVTYKNTDRPGAFNKYVTVFSNAAINKEVKLHIKGTVQPEPTDAAPLNNGGIESPVKNN